jgi:purine-cytosine permease-like protein
MKSLQSIINEHLVPFIGYLAAFLAPVGPLIVSIQLVVFSDYLICKMLFRKKNIPLHYTKEKILILTATYIWLILMLRVLEDFLLNDTNAVSNITAGYILWNHLKQLIKNIDTFANTDLWSQIENIIKKIKL